MLLLIVLSDALLVGVFVGSVANPHVGLLAAFGAVAVPYLMLWSIAWGVGRFGVLGRLNRDHPLRVGAFTPGSGGRLSTIMAGSRSVRLNNCVMIAADDEYLHLKVAIPMTPSSRGASVPWEQVEEIQRSQNMAKLRLFDGSRLWIPWRFAESEMALRAGMGS